MKSSKASFLKNTTVYTAVTILQKGLSFFLLPLYTAVLSPKDYGVQTVVVGIALFFSTLFTMALDAAASRFYFEYESNKMYQKKVLGTIITFVITANATAMVLLLCAHKMLIAPFAQGIPFYPLILLGLINALFSPVFTIYQSILRMQNRAGAYSVNLLGFVAVQIGLTLISILIFKMGVLGVLLANAVTSILFFVLSLIGMKKIFIFCFDFKALKGVMRYSLSILPHSLSNWMNQTQDRIILTNYSSLSAVGIYQVGFQFGAILNMLTLSVNMAYVPWLYKQLKGKEYASVAAISDLLTVIYCFIGQGICLFGYEAMHLFIDPRYFEALQIFPLCIFGFVFWGYYLLFVNVLFYEIKAAKYIPVATLSGAVINLALNLYFIPKMGIMGAALAGFLSKLLTSLSILFISKKVCNIPFKWMRMYVLALVLFCISFFAVLYNFTFPVRIGLVILSFLIIWLFYPKILASAKDFIRRDKTDAEPT